MALAEIQPAIKEGKKGGGLFGSLLGGTLGLVAGGLLAPVTGGASLGAAIASTAAGAASGAGLGMQAGSLIGEKIKPTTGAEASQTVGQSQTKKAPLTAMASSPEVQLSQVLTAKKQVPGSNLPPATADEYMRILGEAEGKLKSRLA